MHDFHPTFVLEYLEFTWWNLLCYLLSNMFMKRITQQLQTIIESSTEQDYNNQIRNALTETPPYFATRLLGFNCDSSAMLGQVALIMAEGLGCRSRKWMELRQCRTRQFLGMLIVLAPATEEEGCLDASATDLQSGAFGLDTC